MIGRAMMSFAGLGLFLFGMTLLELALKDAAGRGFKEIIKKSTNTVPKAIFSGAFATAILQSSSVVSLIVLSLVGAGIIALKSGIGVVFGANIGTTATAWIVAYLGFEMDIEAFVLPAVGIGGLMVAFFRDSPGLKAAGKIVMGFGLLFLGLGYMKSGMSGFSKVDIGTYSSHGTLIFVLVGMAITAVIQSSSATTAIALTALGTGLIDFTMAAAMVIGANVGTTVTAMLGALGGTPDKKRVAAAHFLFNMTTGIIALILLRYLTTFLLTGLGLERDEVIGLAAFHTLFNVMGVLMLSPFIPGLTRLLSARFKRKEKSIAHFIDKVTTEIPEAAIMALRNEVLHLFRMAMQFSLLVINVRPSDVLKHRMHTDQVLRRNHGILNVPYEEVYREMKRLDARIITFATSISAEELATAEVKQVDNALRATRKIAEGAKTMKDIRQDMDDFVVDDTPFVIRAYRHFRERMIRLVRNIGRLVDGEDAQAATIERIFLDIERDNDSAIYSLAKALKRGEIDDTSAATLINVNHSLYRTSRLFLEVVRLLLGYRIVKPRT